MAFVIMSLRRTFTHAHKHAGESITWLLLSRFSNEYKKKAVFMRNFSGFKTFSALFMYQMSELKEMRRTENGKINIILSVFVCFFFVCSFCGRKFGHNFIKCVLYCRQRCMNFPFCFRLCVYVSFFFFDSNGIQKSSESFQITYWTIEITTAEMWMCLWLGGCWFGLLCGECMCQNVCCLHDTVHHIH